MPSIIEDFIGCQDLDQYYTRLVSVAATKEGSAPLGSASGTDEDDAGPDEDAPGPDGDEAGPVGDVSGLFGDASGPDGDEAGPDGDASGPDGDETGPDGDDVGPFGDEAGPNGEAAALFESEARLSDVGCPTNDLLKSSVLRSVFVNLIVSPTAFGVDPQ